MYCCIFQLLRDKDSNNNAVWLRRSASVGPHGRQGSSSSSWSTHGCYKYIPQPQQDIHQHRRRVKSVGEASLEYSKGRKVLKDYENPRNQTGSMKSRTLDRQSSINYSSLRRHIRLHDDPIPAMSALWSEQAGVTLGAKGRPLILSVDSGHCGTLRREPEDDEGYLRASCTGSCGIRHDQNGDTLRSTTESEQTTSADSMEENVFIFEQDPKGRGAANSNIDIESEVNLNVSIYDNIKTQKTTSTALENQTYGLVFQNMASTNRVDGEKDREAGVRQPKLGNDAPLFEMTQKNGTQIPPRKGSLSSTSDTSSGFQSDYNDSPKNSHENSYANGAQVTV